MTVYSLSDNIEDSVQNITPTNPNEKDEPSPIAIYRKEECQKDSEESEDIGNNDFDEEPGFLDVLGAAFRQYNVTASGATWVKRELSDDNMEELERHDQEILERASTSTHVITAGLALLLDPVNYVPGLNVAKKLNKGSKMLRLALTGGNAALINSSGRVLTQKTKPAKDIAYETLEGVIFSAALGKSADVCKKAGIHIHDFVASLPEKLKSNWAKSEFKEEAGILFEKINDKYIRCPEIVQKLFRNCPLRQLNASPFQTVRKYASAMWSNPLLKERFEFTSANDEVNAIKNLAISHKNKLLSLRKTFTKMTELSGEDFSELVSVRVRYYNTDIIKYAKNLDHKIFTYWNNPDIKQAADGVVNFIKTIEKHFGINTNEALLLEDQKLLAAEGLENEKRMADILLPRNYNINKVLEDKEEFKSIINKYLEINQTPKNHRARRADKIFYDVIGLNNSNKLYVSSNNISSMKSRSLNIQDLVLHDFIEHDIFSTIDHITDKWVPYLAKERALKAADLGENIQAIKHKVYLEAMEMLKSTKSSEEINKIKEALPQAYELIDKCDAIFHNTFGKPSTKLQESIATGVKWFNAWTYMESCGSIIFSMVADPVIMASRLGGKNVSKAYILELKRLSCKLKNFIRKNVGAKEIENPKTLSELYNEYYNDLGIALDESVEDLKRTFQSREANEALFSGNIESTISEIGRKAVRLSDKAFLINPLLKCNQKMASVLYTSDFVKAVLGELKPTLSREIINDTRLSPKIIESLKEQFLKPGIIENKGNLKLVNLEQLDSESAFILGQDVGRVVKDLTLTPDSIHTPFWTKTLFGKAFFMFTSWTSAFTNKFFLPTWSKYGLKVLLKYYIPDMALSIPSVYLKNAAKGNPYDIRDPKFWESVLDNVGLPFTELGPIFAIKDLFGNRNLNNSLGSSIRRSSPQLHNLMKAVDILKTKFNGKDFTPQQQNTLINLVIPMTNAFWINDVIERTLRSKNPEYYEQRSHKYHYMKKQMENKK